MSKRRIVEFAVEFPKAAKALNVWARVSAASSWKNPADLKRTFSTADFVGDKTVFDIGGNKFRLIAFVHYRVQIVYVKHILTHTEYDKGDWKR